MNAFRTSLNVKSLLNQEPNCFHSMNASHAFSTGLLSNVNQRLHLHLEEWDKSLLIPYISVGVFSPLHFWSLNTAWDLSVFSMLFRPKPEGLYFQLHIQHSMGNKDGDPYEWVPSALDSGRGSMQRWKLSFTKHQWFSVGTHVNERESMLCSRCYLMHARLVHGTRATHSASMKLAD